MVFGRDRASFHETRSSRACVCGKATAQRLTVAEVSWKFPADPDPAKHEPEETGGATLGVAFRDFWRMVLAHIERGDGGEVLEPQISRR